MDCGINYEDESIKGFFEKVFNFSKLQVRKIIRTQRRKSHGKLLNATSSHNKVLKTKKYDRDGFSQKEERKFRS